MTPAQLSIQFFWQLAVILLVCRLVGWCARYLGQPQVVGEMIAGIMLGPSVLGQLAPSCENWIFPHTTLPMLFVVSQIGLALYMFIVGTEFRADLFQDQIVKAMSVSLAGMIVPFILGGLVGIWLLGRADIFSSGVTAFEAALYLGASMCITAFPMLARIIHERKLTGTALGTLALAAGAIDDVAAWAVLAVVLACFSHLWQTAVWAIFGGLGYCLLVLWGVRFLMLSLGRAVERKKRLSEPVLAFTLMLVMAGAGFTDWIGLYAVFGAFVLGVAMPRGFFVEELRRQTEPFVVVFLLPLFFTYSGLNTRLDLIATPELWLLALVIILVACLGKGVACWAAARWQGENQSTALAVGALMNARGLMELIILNIGLQRGLILPTLFSLMVLMAVVTTLMASPIFELVYGRFQPTGKNSKSIAV